MVEVVLDDYRIKSIDMRNDIAYDGILSMTNTFEFKVSYSREDSRAVAELTEHVSDKETGDRFYISLTIEGIFSVSGVNGLESKKEAHVRCYDQIFPYAGQIISQLASNSGISGLILKKIPMKESSINFSNGAQEKHEGKMIRFPQ